MTSARPAGAGQPTHQDPCSRNTRHKDLSTALPLATRTRALSPRCLTHPSGSADGHDRGTTAADTMLASWVLVDDTTVNWGGSSPSCAGSCPRSFPSQVSLYTTGRGRPAQCQVPTLEAVPAEAGPLDVLRLRGPFTSIGHRQPPCLGIAVLTAPHTTRKTILPRRLSPGSARTPGDVTPAGRPHRSLAATCPGRQAAQARPAARGWVRRK